MPFVDFTAVASPDLAACSAALERYAEPLLRAVAGKWLRLRNQLTVDELRARLVEALSDPVAVDRALKNVSPTARRLLRLIGIGRQLRWRLRALADFLAVLAPDSGIDAVQQLLEAGFLYPELLTSSGSLASFAIWQKQAPPLAVTAVPLAAARVRVDNLGLSQVRHETLAAATPQEADGLEWLLRLAVVWQVVQASPLRRTLQGGLFKRDLDRLRTHSLLGAPPAEQIQAVPAPEILAMSLARSENMVLFDSEQIRAQDMPSSWHGGLSAALMSLWSAWTAVDEWDAVSGNATTSTHASPAVIAVLALTALGSIPAGEWACASDFDDHLKAIPDSPDEAASAFLLGVGHQFRIVQATRHRGAWWVRLTPLGRAIVDVAKTATLAPPACEQTLLVQPNLEVLLYRQGLTPALVARLTLFAEWKTLGLACTLALTADSVYRGLEAGETLGEMVALLERHGTRAISENVLSSLRSWAAKRERVLVFSSALLLEFRTEADLDRALRRGIIEYRISERIGLIGSEERIDYGQFRLVGTRDYLAPDERCVDVNGDGLSLMVNEHKSDLLLESEIRRFAEPVAGPEERPRFRMTPATLLAARQRGLDVKGLNGWFLRRTGEPLSATARLLLTGETAPPLTLATLIVLRAPTVELTDGIAHWAETAPFISERLGPTLLGVAPAAVEPLRAKLAELGIRVGLMLN